MANWLSIRFLLTISVALDLDTQSIDFTMAYTQADLKVLVFIEIPWGFKLKDIENPNIYYLKLLVNWYGLKDGGLNWYDCIKTGLEDRGFIPLQINPCLFTRGSLIVILYVDDILIAAKHSTKIKNLIKSLKEGIDITTSKVDLSLKKFTFTGDGTIKTFLGVNVDKTHNYLHLTQTHLISRILDIVDLDQTDESSRNTKDTPAVKPLLIKDTNGEKRYLT